MIFNPVQFLDFSKNLRNDSIFTDLETNTRVIISRAYYSAFLHAKEYLKEKEGVEFTNDRYDHISVEQMLKIRVNRTIGSIIRELRENRHAADYELNNPAIITTRARATRIINFDKQAQNDCICLAESIISRLSRS
jgi:uncharacterized protein (UPF0332 family)